MADTRTLKLSLLADVNKFTKGMNSAEKSTKDLSSKVSYHSKAMAKSFAAVGVAAGVLALKIGMDSVKAASDLGEEISKTNVIFGKSAKAVEAFSESASKSLGMSKIQALKASSTFATLGKAAGLTGADLTKFSEKSVTLAADLGSFYNTSADDAILAIGSALRGEAEPIRKYGVLLSAAALEQGAMNYEARTGIPLERDKKNQLTETAKVLARYEIIIAQTSDAQGDFARTSGGLAAQQKIMKADLANLNAEMGVKLLPTMLKVTKATIDLIDGFGGKAKGGLSDRARELKGDIGNTGMSSLGGALKALADSFVTLFNAFTGEGSATDKLTSFANALENLAKGINAVADAVKKAKTVGGKILDTIIVGDGKSGYASFIPGFAGGASGTNGGSRAAGGSVMAGKPVRVGEFGPEIFYPSGSGSIRPNAGGSGNVVININGAVDANGTRRQLEQLFRTSSRQMGLVNLNGARL
jgi:hypothetical protein